MKSKIPAIDLRPGDVILFGGQRMWVSSTWVESEGRVGFSSYPTGSIIQVEPGYTMHLLGKLEGEMVNL